MCNEITNHPPSHPTMPLILSAAAEDLHASERWATKAPVTPGLRLGYDLPATDKCCIRGQVVEITYDWSQRSWVIARAKSVAARSWTCSKPRHTGLTTRLRPTCDRKMLQSWVNRRKNIRLVAEVVRLVTRTIRCDCGFMLNKDHNRYAKQNLPYPPQSSSWLHPFPISARCPTSQPFSICDIANLLAYVACVAWHIA